MRKWILLLFLLSALLPAAACTPDTPDESLPVSEAASIAAPEGPYQAAQVFITTSAEITKDAYVQASVRIVDPNGVFAEINDSESTVKVRGNSTSSGAKKPYNIKLSAKKDVLGMGRAKKWCLLANMYDKTMLRNKLSYDFAADIGMDFVSASEFVELYLNGEYRGCYLLTEALEIGETRVDLLVEENEFLLEYEPYPGYSNPISFYTSYYNLLLGFNDPTDPAPSQQRWVKDFFREAEEALATGNRERIEQYFDIGSFVDSFIVNELFKNIDYATSSTRFYIMENKLCAGPLWDLDLSSGNTDADYYTDYHNDCGNENPYASCEGLYCDKLWNGALLQYDWFVDCVRMRYTELSPAIEALTTDTAQAQNKIDALLSRYGDAIRRNYEEAGWSITAKYSDYERIPFPTYEENVEYLREWLVRRHAWLKSYFGIA